MVESGKSPYDLLDIGCTYEMMMLRIKPKQVTESATEMFSVFGCNSIKFQEKEDIIELFQSIQSVKGLCCRLYGI
jgi:hypothetical protein